jgi:hypothetical protein
MPTVKNVGEPCAGEPHARFEVAAGGTRHQSAHGRAALAPPADPTDSRLRTARTTALRDEQQSDDLGGASAQGMQRSDGAGGYLAARSGESSGIDARPIDPSYVTRFLRSARDKVARMAATAEDREHRVSPRELFFDLVFVFAFTQVATLLADDPTFAGIGRGVLVLAALWWAWTAYAWLTTTSTPRRASSAPRCSSR